MTTTVLTEQDILSAARERDELSVHEWLEASLERDGLWWLTCGDCGAAYTTLQTNRGIGFELIDEGSERCLERAMCLTA